MQTETGRPPRNLAVVMVSKKLTLALFFSVSLFSFLKIFRFTTNNPSVSLQSDTTPPTLCMNGNQTSTNQPPNSYRTQRHFSRAPGEDTLTAKEYQLLLDVISKRVPCNLLWFGTQPSFLNLSRLSTGGTTLFLEDNPEKLKLPKIKGVKSYLVKYHEKCSQAYELLKQARENPECIHNRRLLYESSCKLALTGLPGKIYRRKWDVIVVDGPVGDHLEAPGRMATIYSAAVFARIGNATDVFIHDIDRTIEKWYSWEFLCQENLVSSRGKLWHFGIRGDLNFFGFCPVVSLKSTETEVMSTLWTLARKEIT